jgi:hypothetical protein
MAFAYIFSLGDYVYSDPTTHLYLDEVEDEPLYKTLTGETPGVDGMFGDDAKSEGRRIRFGGLMIGDDFDDLRAKRDQFFAFHQQGILQKALLWNDRYCWAMLDGPVSFTYNRLNQWKWSVTLLAPDATFYDPATDLPL